MPPVVEQLPIKDAYLITVDRYADDRGYFNELFNEKSYPDFIRGSIAGDWKQSAASMTVDVDTIRGLHLSPYNKFCSVITGAIFDVIVDMREDSPTFLKWCGSMLSEENRRQVHVPAFCLHGLLALRPNTRMMYLQGGTFNPKHESDANPFDPFLDVHWPLSNPQNLIVSDRDRNAPSIIDESRRPHLKDLPTKKRALIIGASGQVGSALCQEMSSNGYSVYGTHQQKPFPNEYTVKFDLAAAAEKPELAVELMRVMHPAIVVICAAFTWVDGAEEQQDLAYAVNVHGPAAVAAAAREIGAKVVAYSSDYIWDGTSGPYSEDVPDSAISVYGKSKVAMEKALFSLDPSVLVLRTTVVYGPEKHGKNFIYQLCQKLAAGETMKVINDQISTPTYNRDLASLTRLLVEAGASGAYNACGLELLSRYDFAVAAAGALGLPDKQIQPCLTSDQKQRAKRPLKAGMLMTKAQQLLGSSFPRMRGVSEALADWQSVQLRGEGGNATLLLAASKSHL